MIVANCWELVQWPPTYGALLPRFPHVPCLSHSVHYITFLEVQLQKCALHFLPRITAMRLSMLQGHAPHPVLYKCRMHRRLQLTLDLTHP